MPRRATVEKEFVDLVKKHNAVRLSLKHLEDHLGARFHSPATLCQEVANGDCDQRKSECIGDVFGDAGLNGAGRPIKQHGIVFALATQPSFNEVRPDPAVRLETKTECRDRFKLTNDRWCRLFSLS